MDDCFDLPLFEPFAQAVGVVSFVCEQPLWSGDGSKQWSGHGDVGDVSRGQSKRDRPAAIIGQSMDFARSSAARTANRFREIPLFEPAAGRSALTWLLAMESSSGTGPAAAIFSKMRCQIRRWDQRLERHCHIEQVEAVFDRGEARLRHWNRVAGLSPG